MCLSWCAAVSTAFCVLAELSDGLSRSAHSALACLLSAGRAAAMAKYLFLQSCPCADECTRQNFQKAIRDKNTIAIAELSHLVSDPFVLQMLSVWVQTGFRKQRSECA